MLTLFLLCASTIVGELKGVLINGSGEGAGSAQSLQLILLENNMITLASLSDVEGSFTLSTEVDLAGKSLLLQATKDGVFYSKPVKLSEAPIHLTVYDVGEEAEIRATIGSLALYAYAETMDIGLFYNIHNVSEPKLSFSKPEGTFSFRLIPGGTDLEASTNRGSMPLRQKLEVVDGSATLNYTLKPGATQLMVRTHHVYQPDQENRYRIPLPADQRILKLLTIPTSLQLQGDGINFMAKDDKGGMNLYEFEPTKGQTELILKIKGKPLVRPLDSPRDAGDASKSAGHGSKIESRQHILGKYRWLIIGSVLALLSCFVFLGFRR